MTSSLLQIDLDRLVHTQSELQPFLLKPVPEGYVMRCIVKREKKMLGLGENIVLCIQEPGVWQNDKKHHRVLLAQKKQKSSTLNMHINLPEIMGRQRLAKIRSLDKKEYTLFDEGKKKDRKELGSCKVTTAGPTKPITLECVVKLQEELFVNNISLETIQPKYNKDKGSFFLPFERVGERVTMNSRHNFLMKKVEDSGKKKKKPLQLGKVDHGVFALDVRTPLTPLHAFYIILCHMQE